MGLQIEDILGDDGAAFDASRQVTPVETNWRLRGRERVSAHGISFAEKKENPYLLRASFLKGSAREMVRGRAGGSGHGRAALLLSSASRERRGLRIHREAEHFCGTDPVR